MLKRLLSVAIALIMGFGMVTIVSAEDLVTNKEVMVINEYELAEELAAQTPTVLLESGFNTQEIAEIKNYKKAFDEHIRALNTLSDEVLEKHGYSEEQVSIIHNFTGSEQEMLRLGATLTFTAYTGTFKFDGTYTRGNVYYSWNWQSVPVFKMQDMVAVSWNDWIVTSETSTVNYYNVNTGASYINKTATFSQDGNGTFGAGHKFSASISDNYYYAKRGSGRFSVRSSEHCAKDISYYFEFGHSQIQPHISFSVGVGGANGSISFSTGATTVGSYKGSTVATD